MPGASTLVVTTQSGVRPLGVRGEPLHNSAPQLRRVVRRRLGDAAADLLADPQPHENGKAIDWHAGWTGVVQPLSGLDPARRDAVLAEVERTLAEIRRLGDALASAGPREDMGVVGLSLKLAARAPSPSFVFLVGERPVIVAWGYEQEAATALLPLAVAQIPQRRSVIEPPVAAAPSLPAVRPTVPVIPWARALAVALPLLLLVLASAWLLRGCLPIDPAVALATREGPPAPPAPPPAPDPSPMLKASLASEASRAKALQVELSLAEAELKRRIADCKPPDAPKPPQVAAAPPPPPPPKPVAPTPPPVSTPRPGDDRLRLPSPTGNMSFLEGCWRTDPFRHERNQPQAGVSTYCFDASGNGQLEWRRGRTACRTRAQARFEGAVLRLRDADTNCNDGSRWYADQLVCQRGADDVAQCSGSSRGAFGPTAWTVNMHKLK